jgi:hypothetical protein
MPLFPDSPRLDLEEVLLEDPVVPPATVPAPIPTVDLLNKGNSFKNYRLGIFKKELLLNGNSFLH